MNKEQAPGSAHESREDQHEAARNQAAPETAPEDEAQRQSGVADEDPLSAHPT